MAGFFPHTGQAAQGYTSLPTTTYDTFLNDLVTDLGTGINGWTLWDDQRSITPYGLYWPWCGGFNYMRDTSESNRFTLTNASPTVWWYRSGYSAYGARADWDFTPNVSQVSWDNVNWYTVLSVSDYRTFTLTTNYAGASNSGAQQNLYHKVAGYIVLKCTSSQKSFYVKIQRPLSYNCLCLVQVFETWDANAHTGTGGGPQERMRAYTNQGTGTKTLQYCAFFLPDAFVLWGGGDPAASGGGQYWDLFYVGNMTPVRSNDSTCLIQACTNQDFSGIGIVQQNGVTLGSSYTGTWGAAPMCRNLPGNLWTNPQSNNSFNTNNLYALSPRGLDYLWGANRTNLDESAKMQFIEYDAYLAGPMAVGNAINEGKRGELKYLKSPVMSPSSMHLASLGTADDGNTYMLLRCSYPWQSNRVDGSGWNDWYNANSTSGCMSGFAHTNCVGSIGDFGSSYGSNVLLRRYFLLPINI